MIIAEKNKVLSYHIDAWRSRGLSIGFVPTMGALHDGHMSLIRVAQKYSDIVVCSIFVNPIQFNNVEDLKKYPRPIENDLKMLEGAGVHLAYTPTEHEIYPEGLDSSIDLDLKGLDRVMEGTFRPGHFDGVCIVVKRLLDLVRPDHLYMGQKDFQQFSIINHMIQEFQLPVQLRVVKTKRDISGLALSSRNIRLSDEGKKLATAIFKALNYCKRNYKHKSSKFMEKHAIQRLKDAGLVPEYFEIGSGFNLQRLDDLEGQEYIVAFCAAYLENVRLIDNLIIKKPGKIRFYDDKA
jgi:pantoate--beta-alanine ligase